MHPLSFLTSGVIVLCGSARGQARPGHFEWCAAGWMRPCYHGWFLHSAFLWSAGLEKVNMDVKNRKSGDGLEVANCNAALFVPLWLQGIGCHSRGEVARDVHNFEEHPSQTGRGDAETGKNVTTSLKSEREFACQQRLAITVVDGSLDHPGSSSRAAN